MLLALARALEDAGFFGDSAIAYDAYVVLRPDNDTARRDRAVVNAAAYGSIAKLDEAIAELRRYVSRFPSDSDGYYKLAMVNLERDSEGAVKLLDRAVSLQPDNASARCARGILLSQSSRLPEALTDLLRATALAPDHVGILTQLGTVYVSLNRPQDAVPVLRRAKALEPMRRDVVMQLGRALMSMGRVQEAQTVLAAVETLPQGRATSERAPTVLELLSLPRADRLARRVAELIRGVELSPQDVDVKLRLASALVDAGRTGQADATLRKIDGPLENHIEYARLLDATGRIDDARHELVRAIQTSGGSADVAHQAALLIVKWGNDKEALSVTAKASDQPSLLMARALALERTGQPSQADIILRRSEARWPEWGGPFLLHGSLLALRGQRGPAVRMLSSAHALGEVDAELSNCLASGEVCTEVAWTTALSAVAGHGHGF